MANLKKAKEESNDEIEVSEEEVEIPEFELLAGYTDAEGTVHKSFTLREMTGRDEEMIQKADYRQNGSKMITALLSRCVTSIGTLSRKDFDSAEWTNIIQSMYIGDQDYMLIKLREMSVGEEMELSHECPTCKEKLTTYVSMSELEVTPFDGITQIDFSLPKGFKDRKGVLHKDGVIRQSNGLDREILTPIAKKNVAQATTMMLTRLCKFNDGFPVSSDVMLDLTTKDREYLQKLLNEHTFGIKTEIEITCTACGETFTGSLNATNFI